MSPSASLPSTVPATRPVVASGRPVLATAIGTVFCGTIVTLTGTLIDPPWPSLIARVKASEVSAAVAVNAAAA